MSNEQSSTTSSPVRAIDLFCGIGGSSLGASQAGAKIIAGFDMWDLAGNVFRDNFPDAILYSGKLEDIDPIKVKESIGEVDLIIASPECTAHSVARGNKMQSQESLETAWQVTRFADVFRPRWIVIENVIQMKQWMYYEQFKGKLRKQGYHIREQRLVASDFGTPQARKRLYIICDNQNMPTPVRSFDEINIRHAADIVSLNGRYNCTPLRKERRAKATIDRADRAIASLGSQEPFLIVYYSSDGAGGWQRLDVPLRTVTTVDRFALVKPGKNGYEMRMLQVPELRAAMGFPDEFEIDHGNRREKIHMLGNAVCPPVMKAIVSIFKQEDLPDHR